MHRLWDLLEVEIERRQLPQRALTALVDAATGLKIRNATYRPAADVSESVASTDLKHLAEAGLLVAQGERRGRYYVASSVLQAIRRGAREPREIEDPFA